MKLNAKVKAPQIQTHEGGKATPPPHAAAALRRAVMACMLWEDQFYEDGMTIADRIKQLVPLVPAEVAAHFAIKAREDMKLRHAPLLLVREMARGPVPHRRLVGETLAAVIQRADELTEFLAIYWKDGKQPLSAQVKKGLAKAFPKFNEYALAKYNRDGPVKLRDVLFLCHAKPENRRKGKYTKTERKQGVKPVTAQEKKFLAVVDNTLPTPDTWEVELSAGADKKLTWERLITEDKLGSLALLRNLRNMQQVKVDEGLIKMALEKMDVRWVLPHRFIAAARFAPQYEHLLEAKMFECTQTMPKLDGKTLFMIDVSGSMDAPLSNKSDLTRVDAACGLAMIGRELCDDIAVCTFSDSLVSIAPRRGFALREAIVRSQQHSGTYLGKALQELHCREKYDRIIVVTDEQSADDVPAPKGKGYMINVASFKNGVGYGQWNKIDGFSEAVIRYIVEYEQAPDA